jgi:hypothetical protein
LAESARAALLYKPEITVRIDNDEFPGTPLPPEEPTAKNPPEGAVLDYVLKSAAQKVTLTIIDPKRKVVRHLSSEDSVPPMPQTAPIAERWFPPPQRLAITPGMHRFIWDLSWGSSGAPAADVDSGDADNADVVPRGPRVAPAVYQVRLTVDGQTYDQPLTVAMDPRSPARSAVLQQQQEMGLRMYADTLRSRQAMAEMQSVQAEMEGLQPKMEQHSAMSASLDQFTQALSLVLKGDPKSVGLAEANTNLAAALAVVESGDRAIPSQALELYRRSREGMNQRVDQWQRLKGTQLPQLNQQLRKANLKPIQLSSIEQEVFYQMTR